MFPIRRLNCYSRAWSKVLPPVQMLYTALAGLDRIKR